MFSHVDDWLIERCFQPACDAIRRTTGWSKGIPTAIMLVVATIGLIPLAIVIFLGGLLLFWILFIPAAMMFLRIIVSTLEVYSLLSNESRKNQCTDVLDSTRLIEEQNRKETIVFSLAILPLVLAGCTHPDTEAQIVLFFYLIGGIANICADYFKACTDTPPPNQTAWRSLFRRWFFPSRLAQE